MRLTPLHDLTPEQARLRARLQERRGGVNGPFGVLLHSPELGSRLEELSTSIMRDAALPPRLRELTLLIVARRLDAQHSWLAHLDKGLAAGLDAAALARLARGEEPGFPRADEQILHEFVGQALETHFVDDATYAAALARFGERALVDLVVAIGGFAALALVLNTFQVDLPSGTEPPFPDVTGFRRTRRAGATS
ncbi:carboxymuconolactone decarboxylase family protein [Streptomyces sp. NBC_00631]|uniref:carboxymuconolactone decarboxylase family protein n=1 Tax=Streptomyces sp. NBC_00631 TaxID=2975793 RepID=UPI0030DF6F12